MDSSDWLVSSRSIRMAKFVKWLHEQIVCDRFVDSTLQPSSDQALKQEWKFWGIIFLAFFLPMLRCHSLVNVVPKDTRWIGHIFGLDVLQDQTNRLGQLNVSALTQTRRNYFTVQHTFSHRLRGIIHRQWVCGYKSCICCLTV